MSRHPPHPNIQCHTIVTNSMVKAFQKQALLIMAMPVFWGEENLFDYWNTTVENAAKSLHQDAIDVAMTKLTGAPLQVTTHLLNRVVMSHGNTLKRNSL